MLCRRAKDENSVAEAEARIVFSGTDEVDTFRGDGCNMT
jgi:hypothetical protein